MEPRIDNVIYPNFVSANVAFDLSFDVRIYNPGNFQVSVDIARGCQNITPPQPQTTMATGSVYNKRFLCQITMNVAPGVPYSVDGVIRVTDSTGMSKSKPFETVVQ